MPAMGDLTLAQKLVQNRGEVRVGRLDLFLRKNEKKFDRPLQIAKIASDR